VVTLHTAHCRLQKLIVSSALSLCVAGVASAQNDDAQLSNYAALLKKKHDLQVEIGHMELQMQTQEQRIAALEAEIAGIPALKASVPGLVEKMITSYAAEFEFDPPFNASERYERLSKLRDQFDNKSAPMHLMLNRAIGMYEAEVNLGMTVDQYPGNHPVPPPEEGDEAPTTRTAGWRVAACEVSLLDEGCILSGEMREAIRDKTGKEFVDLREDDEKDAANLKLMLQRFKDDRKLQDGNYLRVGRLALIYADVDGKEVWRYDIDAKRRQAGYGGSVAAADGEGDGQPESAITEWLKIEGAEQIDLYRSVKMAKGEAAVNVMPIPVLVE